MKQTNNQNRSWVWQTCTEFGWFQTTYGSIFFPDQLTLEEQVEWCSEIYGVDNMTPHTEWTNTYYGYNLLLTLLTCVVDSICKEQILCFLMDTLIHGIYCPSTKISLLEFKL
jgi:hypothetical protein